MHGKALLLLLALPAGCSAEIGDECDTSVDCSPDGDRVCDLSQRGGYCTIEDCAPDGCPDGALCVEFAFETPRLARRYCMASCESGGDCRDHYACVRAGEQDAQVIDGHR